MRVLEIALDSNPELAERFGSDEPAVEFLSKSAELPWHKRLKESIDAAFGNEPAFRVGGEDLGGPVEFVVADLDDRFAVEAEFDGFAGGNGEKAAVVDAGSEVVGFGADLLRFRHAAGHRDGQRDEDADDGDDHQDFGQGEAAMAGWIPLGRHGGGRMV